MSHKAGRLPESTPQLITISDHLSDSDVSSDPAEMTSTNTCLSLYQQFKALHEEELFDSLVDVGDFLLTSDCRPRNSQAQRELFRGPREEFRSIVLYGYALIQEHRYRQAIDVYSRACNMLHHTYPPPGSSGRIGGRSPNGPKVEAPPGTTGFERMFTEDDIKFRLAQAFVFAEDTDEALSVLDTIPPANRSAKVHVLMTKLNPSRQVYVLDKMKQVVRQGIKQRKLEFYPAASGMHDGAGAPRCVFLRNSWDLAALVDLLILNDWIAFGWLEFLTVNAREGGELINWLDGIFSYCCLDCTKIHPYDVHSESQKVPMALRVLRGWFACGGKLVELNANLGKNIAEEKVAHLVNKLIHCHSYMATGSFYYAHQAASSLLDDSVLSHNPMLMTIQAKCQNALGNQELALKILNSIDHTHPNFYQDLDEYAAILYEQGDQQTLQKLADRLVKCASLTPEAWTSKGYAALCRKDFTNAIRYAEHATNLDNTHYRAHVLRGLVHSKKDDYAPAQRSFQRAFDLCPTCLDAHKYRIEIYQKRFGEKETLAAATTMYRICKKNPRCVQIYADCYIHFNYRLRDIATTLEKHLKSYPKDRKSSVLLATAYEKLKENDRGIEVLKKQLLYGTSKEIHQLLARFYHNLDNEEKEAEHNNLAESFPHPGMDPRADSPMPGPSNGFRSNSPSSPRPASPSDEEAANDESEVEDDEEEE